MMKKSSILSVVVMFFFLQNFSQETERVLPIIPKPAELTLLKGNFKVEHKSIIDQVSSSISEIINGIEDDIKSQQAIEKTLIEN